MHIHFDCAEEFPSPIGYAYMSKVSNSRTASDTGTAGGVCSTPSVCSSIAWARGHSGTGTLKALWPWPRMGTPIGTCSMWPLGLRTGKYLIVVNFVLLLHTLQLHALGAEEIPWAEGRPEKTLCTGEVGRKSTGIRVRGVGSLPGCKPEQASDGCKASNYNFLLESSLWNATKSEPVRLCKWKHRWLASGQLRNAAWVCFLCAFL